MKMDILKRELIQKSPLRAIIHENDSLPSPGGFGAVLARAGLGKTALLVQIAIDNMLRDKRVLHISMGDPVRKICLWYEEVYRNMTSSYESHQTGPLWETVLSNRFIMTFNINKFSMPKFKERLADLTEQAIFHPEIILFDGLPFHDNSEGILSELKQFAEKGGFRVWFTVKTHRNALETDILAGVLPEPISDHSDFFDLALQIRPEQEKIVLKVIKSITDVDGRNVSVLVDPTTMLAREEAV